MDKKLALFKNLGRFVSASNTEGHIKSLGIEVINVEIGKVLMKLTYHNALIASPDTGAIAGGALTALLDTCSGFVSSTVLEPMGVTATIDLRVDYLRMPEPNKAIYAEVEVIRTTKYIIFTRGVAWQNKDKPLAYSAGNFVNNPMSDAAKRSLIDISEMSYKLPPRQGNYQPVNIVSEDVSKVKLTQAREQGDVNLLIDFIPYTKLLKMERIAAEQEGQWLYLMPPAKQLIGNHMIPVLHGGAIAGFMETSAILHLIMKMTVEHVPKVVDINIDYIRPALLKPTYSRCKIIRFGSRLVSLEVTCWQDTESEYVAKARLQLLVDKNLI